MKKYLIPVTAIVLLFTGMVVAQQDEPMKPADTTMTEEKPAETTMTKAEPAAEKAMPVASFTVEGMACGTGVMDRELEGEATTFPSDIEKVFCWCTVVGCEEPTTVEHVWYHNGEEIARVPLEINYPRARTWSSKNMIPEWAGDWKVDLVDDAGKVVASTSFKLE
jgi:hypothetical protein